MPLQEIESTIEFVLRNAGRIKTCVEEKRLDSGAGHDSNSGGGRGSRISNPTAAQALQRVAPIAYIHCPFGPAINGRRDAKYIRLPEKWLQVEDATRCFYMTSDNKRVKTIYERRYLQGEYGETWEKTCRDLGITHNWYYVVVHDIIRFAEIYASGIGLISPYSRFSRFE